MPESLYNLYNSSRGGSASIFFCIRQRFCSHHWTMDIPSCSSSLVFAVGFSAADAVVVRIHWLQHPSHTGQIYRGNSGLAVRLLSRVSVTDRAYWQRNSDERLTESPERRRKRRQSAPGARSKTSSHTENCSHVLVYLFVCLLVSSLVLPFVSFSAFASFCVCFRLRSQK